MSYDPAGIYNLPPAYKAEPGTTIRSEQHNAPLEDIAQALSSVLVRDGRNGMVGNLGMGGFKITNLAPGTAATDAATVSQLVPIGTIVDYAGSTAPAGWLFCAGQAVSRSTYAALFSVIGTTYGNGNGTTTFNLPDLRGRVTAGRDNMGGTSADRLTNKPGGVNGDVLGAAGGAETHALVVAQLAKHLHGSGTLKALFGGRHSHLLATRVGGTGGQPNSVARDAEFSLTTSNTAVQQGGEHEHTVGGNTSETGAGEAHNNVQPTIILNKIIKATN